MSDDIKDKILDQGKDWISEKENQEKLKSWAAKAWQVVKGWFSKKK